MAGRAVPAILFDVAGLEASTIVLVESHRKVLDSGSSPSSRFMFASPGTRKSTMNVEEASQHLRYDADRGPSRKDHCPRVAVVLDGVYNRVPDVDHPARRVARLVVPY